MSQSTPDAPNQPSSEPRRKTKRRPHHEARDPEKISKIVFFRELQEHFPEQILLSDRKLCEYVGVPHGSAAKRGRWFQEKPPQGLIKRDTRGRPRMLSDEQIRQLIEASDQAISEGRPLHFVQIAKAASITDKNISEHRLVPRMRLQGLNKCFRNTCIYPLLSRADRENRAKICQWIKSWDDNFLQTVRFTRVLHFGLSRPGTLRDAGKPTEHYCSACIDQNPRVLARESASSVRWHCWAMVGWNFKSNLFFYDYRDRQVSDPNYLEILRRMVLPALEQNPSIFLMEDPEAQYEGNVTVDIATFKQRNNIQSAFNAARCPDLFPVEGLWHLLQHRLKIEEWFDELALRDAVVREWERLTIDEVNKEISEMYLNAEQCLPYSRAEDQT